MKRLALTLMMLSGMAAATPEATAATYERASQAYNPVIWGDFLIRMLFGWAKTITWSALQCI